MLLLSGPGVLEPHLRDPLAEARQLRDPLQVLAVRVGVDLEVCLKDLKLLVREGCPHPLALPLAALSVCVLCEPKEPTSALVYVSVFLLSCLNICYAYTSIS